MDEDKAKEMKAQNLEKWMMSGYLPMTPTSHVEEEEIKGKPILYGIDEKNSDSKYYSYVPYVPTFKEQTKEKIKELLKQKNEKK